MIGVVWFQYVLKTIELASASDKERTAAEQEVDVSTMICVTCMRVHEFYVNEMIINIFI